MSGGLDQYTESEVQRLLTEDPRLAEQGIDVIRREDHLVLCGEVESHERRALIEQVVAESFPGIRVHCDIGVTRIHEPEEVEEL